MSTLAAVLVIAWSLVVGVFAGMGIRYFHYGTRAARRYLGIDQSPPVPVGGADLADLHVERNLPG